MRQPYIPTYVVSWIDGRWDFHGDDDYLRCLAPLKLDDIKGFFVELNPNQWVPRFRHADIAALQRQVWKAIKPYTVDGSSCGQLKPGDHPGLLCELRRLFPGRIYSEVFAEGMSQSLVDQCLDWVRWEYPEPEDDTSDVCLAITGMTHETLCAVERDREGLD